MSVDLGLQMLEATEAIRKLGSKNVALLAQKSSLEKQLEAVNEKLADFEDELSDIRNEFSEIRKILTDELVNALLVGVDKSTPPPKKKTGTKPKEKSGSRVRISADQKIAIMEHLIKECRENVLKLKGPGGLVERFEKAAEELSIEAPGIQSIKFFDFLDLLEGTDFKSLGKREGTEIYVKQLKKRIAASK